MKKTIFGNWQGKDVFLYTIESGNLSVDVSDFGARVNAIRFCGVDVALGFTAPQYCTGKAGATVGRVANRIAGGEFTLNGQKYFLSKNKGEIHAHGGFVGFDKKIFDVVEESDSKIVFSLVSADGEEGYPGKLRLNVVYEVQNDALSVNFSATSDKDTLWNPTNHTYFNLSGEASGECLDTKLWLNADFFTPTDAELIPTGAREKVFGTPFDFTLPKAIGRDFADERLRSTNGYDNNFVLNDTYAAAAESPRTGIKMDLFTDLPCLQFYTANKFSSDHGKSGAYDKWAGFCLEPQFCPNAVNLEGFAKPILKADEKTSYFIVYKFLKSDE